MIALVWEYIFCVFDIILIHSFFGLFLEKKKVKSYIQIILDLLMAIIIFLLTVEHIFNYVSEILSILFTCIYLCFIYKGKIYRKIIMFFLFYVLYMIYTMLMIGAISAFSPSISATITEYNSIIRIGFIVSTRCLAYFILYMIGKKKTITQPEYLFTTHMFYVACISTVVSLVITNMIFQGEFNLNTDKLLLFISLIIILFIFIFMEKKMFDSKIKFKQLESTAYALQMKTEFYESSEEQKKELRRIKHDLKNQLITIEYLLKEHKYEDAKQYLNSLTNLPTLQKKIVTGNDMLDALLNMNIQMYEDFHFKIDVQIKQIYIDQTSIGIIVGNALNNAIEALNKVKGDKWLKICIIEQKEYIKMVFENPYEIEPILENGVLKTTKEDVGNHGIGTLSINKEIKRYQGKVVYDINKEKKVFKISMIMQNNHNNVK